MNELDVNNDGVRLKVYVHGPDNSDEPPILCVHGFPELAYSFRHQLEYFAQQGRRIAALDVRGYGASDKPTEVAAYSMKNLASDVAAVIDALGGSAVLIGHDWGAPVVWHTALRHPDKVAAVVGLSVPYIPPSDTSFMDSIRRDYEGKFFYQLYFQDEGVAEAEFEADPDAIAKVFYGMSAGGIPTVSQLNKTESDGYLTGLPLPADPPEWMADHHIEIYRAAYERGGWRGPLNRYRAQDLDHHESADLIGKHIEQPATFIAGDLDMIRWFIPGRDLYARAGDACQDFRGTTLLEGIGHWVQLEAPHETNQAIQAFLDLL